MTSDTSIAALRRVVESGKHDTDIASILTLLEYVGTDGLTTDEIEQVLEGLHQGVSPRVSELHVCNYPHVGEIIALKATRETRGGDQAHLYVHADLLPHFDPDDIYRMNEPAWHRYKVFADFVMGLVARLERRKGHPDATVDDECIDFTIRGFKKIHDEFTSNFNTTRPKRKKT